MTKKVSYRDERGLSYPDMIMSRESGHIAMESVEMFSLRVRFRRVVRCALAKIATIVKSIESKKYRFMCQR